MDNTPHKPSILVLTTSFPKFIGDTNGNFVFDLCVKLKDDFKVFVLCPKSVGSESKEILDGIFVRRHKQFFLDSIELAYGTSIMTKIKKNPTLLFVLPVFFAYQSKHLYKTCRHENISAIHAHWLIPTAIFPLLYKIFFNSKVKVICTAHGTDVNSFNGIFGTYLKKWILKRADAITVVSNALAKNLNGISPNKTIHVFPMGINTSLFSPKIPRPTIKKDFNIQGSYILYVGEMIPSKGVDLLIEAFPSVLKKFPDLQMVLIGSGLLMDVLMSRCRDLKISEKVFFTGSLPNRELPPFFSSTKLFVLPSHSEGLGLVVAEALSCEAPVLASNLDALHDLIIEGQTGFFIRELTANGISEKIIDLLSQPEMLNSVRKKGRSEIVHKFDWKIVGENYSLLMKILLKEV